MLPSDLDPAELVALGGAVRKLRARRRLSREALGARGGLHRNDVWTLDGPLARSAVGSGLPVRLIEVAGAPRS